MSQQGKRDSILAGLGGLGWPLTMGATASSVFFIMVYRGPLNTPAMHRYFAAHPVSFVATCLFFVGMSALLLKLLQVFAEHRALARIGLSESPPACGQPIGECGRLLDALDQLPNGVRNSYLGNRLYQALEHVERQGSAAGLEDELKYLADVDAARQQEGYALVRIITWATPMLGFLGTVAGITQALGDLNPQELATSIQTAMDGLLAGLYVAFDTTAQGLSLSMTLMFVQFLVDRMETQLLTAVETRAVEELAGRFEQIGGRHDPNLESIRRMSEAVIDTTGTLVERQVAALAVDDRRRTRAVANSDAHVQPTTSGLARQSPRPIAGEARRKTWRAAQASSEQLQQRWEQWQTVLSDNARIMHDQQIELVKQGEIMRQAIQAAGDVVKLEKTLNDNLQLLAGAKNFEDTVMSLAAAIHLLNTRLGRAPDEAPRVDLRHSTSQGRAA